MAWGRIDDKLHAHPKWVAVRDTSPAWLFWSCLSWALGYSPSGFVPTHIAKGFGAQRAMAKLVEAGLWEQGDGGYLIHDFTSYAARQNGQESSPDTKQSTRHGTTASPELSEKRREAGAKGAARRWQGDGKPDGNLPSSADGKPDGNADSNLPSPPRVPARVCPPAGAPASPDPDPDPVHTDRRAPGELREVTKLVAHLGDPLLASKLKDIWGTSPHLATVVRSVLARMPEDARRPAGFLVSEVKKLHDHPEALDALSVHALAAADAPVAKSKADEAVEWLERSLGRKPKSKPEAAE